MALTVTTSTANQNTTSTSWSPQVGQSFAEGDLMVVCIASDNAGTSGARSLAANAVTRTGETFNIISGNTLLNDPGAASAGCTLGMWWCQVKAAMISTDTITVAHSPTTVAKAAVIYKITAASGSQAIFVNSSNTTNQGTAATGNTALTTGSALNGDAVICAASIEYTTQTTTGDSDTTNGNWSAIVTAVATGTTVAGMTCASQSKVVNADGTQSWAITWTNSTDYITQSILVREVSLDRGRPSPARLQAVNTSVW